MNTKSHYDHQPSETQKMRFPELFSGTDSKNQKSLLLAPSNKFSDELDYKHQSASNMFFNCHARTRTLIERYQGEAYIHNLKKKVEEKFCLIDKLLGQRGGFKMDSRFKTGVKNLIGQVYGIARRNQAYLKYINPNKEEPSFHINLKYLFLAVVYLKLKGDLYENLNGDALEIGLGELVKVYGSNEICLGKLGKYIDFVKAIVREFGLGIKLVISNEEKRKLTFCYLESFSKLCSKVIKGSSNYAEFSQKKLKRVYTKIFENFEAKFDCIKGKRVRHFACAIFHISLRLLDFNVTLVELIDILRQDEAFGNIVYHSVTRIIREICDEFVDKFFQLLLMFKHSKILITKRLGNLSCFLAIYESKAEELINQNRVNIKSKIVKEIMKFCLKKKVLKAMKHLRVIKNLNLKKKKMKEKKTMGYLGKRSADRRDYEEASTAEFFFKEEDRISSFSGYPFG